MNKEQQETINKLDRQVKNLNLASFICFMIFGIFEMFTAVSLLSGSIQQAIFFSFMSSILLVLTILTYLDSNKLDSTSKSLEIYYLIKNGRKSTRKTNRK